MRFAAVRCAARRAFLCFFFLSCFSSLCFLSASSSESLSESLSELLSRSRFFFSFFSFFSFCGGEAGGGGCERGDPGAWVGREGGWVGRGGGGEPGNGGIISGEK